MSTQSHRTTRDLIGQLVADRYRIGSLIGEGRAGVVYLAEDVTLQKRVALKVLHVDLSRDTETVARFRREAEAASQLDHPNVVAGRDFGQTEDGLLFLVMDYVEGTSLRAALASATFTTGRAIRIARQIALALGRAHRAGIVHRDIKPENVMLVRREDEPEELVKVLDFGIAHIDPKGEIGDARPALTRAGAILGTPEYMAPEQRIGEIATAASDVYSLGIVLFEMLAGRRPFDPDPAELLSGQVLGPLPKVIERAPGVRVPPPIEAVVRRLLERDPKDRYPSAEAVVAAIDEATRIATSTPPPPLAEARRTAKSILRGAITRASAGLQVVTNRKHRALVTVVSVAVVLLPLMLVGAVVARRGGASTDAVAPGASASTGTSPKSPSPERLHHAASQGIPALEDLSSEFPDDVAVLRELAFAYDGGGRSSDALRTVERATLAARGARTPDLIRIVVRAASKFDTSDEAFRLLEGPLGQDGVEALLELSSDPGLTADTRARASRSLAKSSVRLNASEATGFLLDLRAAKSCEAKRQVLGRSGQYADDRALPTLRALKSTQGCGRHGDEDCHRCLRNDPSLERTIRAAELETTH